MGIINIFNSRKSSTRKSTSKKKNSGFSQAQKEAYAAGQAYELAKAGKRVQLQSKKQEESFRKGMESVKKG